MNEVNLSGIPFERLQGLLKLEIEFKEKVKALEKEKEDFKKANIKGFILHKTDNDSFTPRYFAEYCSDIDSDTKVLMKNINCVNKELDNLKQLKKDEIIQLNNKIEDLRKRMQEREDIITEVRLLLKRKR